MPTYHQITIGGQSGQFVTASDYDALAARLAEAERLLNQAEDALLGLYDPRTRHEVINRLGAFLRASDSAALSLSDYQCSSGRSAEDCMRWMSLSDGKAHCSRTDCTGPARISPIAKPDFWTIQD